MRFEIIQGNEQLFSHSGLALVGKVLSKTRVRERLDKVMLSDHPFPEISHGEVATAMIGLACMGKPDFDAIESFRNDPFFTTSLQIDAVPASPTLRQRVDSANGGFNDTLLEESAQAVRYLAPVITPSEGKLVVIDIDVSPFDTWLCQSGGV